MQWNLNFFISIQFGLLFLSFSRVHAYPASPADMSKYARMAAINLCISIEAGTEFNTASAITGETFAQVIKGNHESTIQEIGSNALTIEELRKGSINTAILGAIQLCQAKVPRDILEKARSTAANFTEKAAGNTSSDIQNYPISNNQSEIAVNPKISGLEAQGHVISVAKLGEAISVKIDGSTLGSGVLVKRDGNRYTVLTAWHVVSGQRPGEELAVFTSDGQQYQVEQGSISQIGNVDLGMLTFRSPSKYETAKVSSAKSVEIGSLVYVTGFPLPTISVPSRLLRFIEGKLVANPDNHNPNGYKLLYSNPTLPGMSGGAVLNDQGQLIGIHGLGETDSKMTEQAGVAVKTGTNQAVPIDYFLLQIRGN